MNHGTGDKVLVEGDHCCGSRWYGRHRRRRHGFFCRKEAHHCKSTSNSHTSWFEALIRQHNYINFLWAHVMHQQFLIYSQLNHWVSWSIIGNLFLAFSCHQESSGVLPYANASSLVYRSFFKVNFRAHANMFIPTFDYLSFHFVSN